MSGNYNAIAYILVTVWWLQKKDGSISNQILTFILGKWEGNENPSLYTVPGKSWTYCFLVMTDSKNSCQRCQQSLSERSARIFDLSWSILGQKYKVEIVWKLYVRKLQFSSVIWSHQTDLNNIENDSTSYMIEQACFLFVLLHNNY